MYLKTMTDRTKTKKKIIYLRKRNKTVNNNNNNTMKHEPHKLTPKLHVKAIRWEGAGRRGAGHGRLGR